MFPSDYDPYSIIKNNPDSIHHDPNLLTAKNDQQQTALHVAVKKGDRYMVELLVDAGAKLDELDGQGRTALHLSVEGNDPEIIQFLIKHGASQLPDQQGDTPLKYALKNNMEIVGALAIHGGDLCDNNPRNWLNVLNEFKNNLRAQQIIFLTACRHGYQEAVIAMLKENPALKSSKDEFGNTPLLYAAAGGQVEFAEWLMQEGYGKLTESTEHGDNALFVAIAYDQCAFVQWLNTKHHVVINQSREGIGGALNQCAYFGSIKTAEWLLEGNIISEDARSSPETILLMTAASGQIDFALWWLDKYPESRNARTQKDRGPLVEMRLSDGATPLLLAVQAGHWKYAAELVKKEFADWNEKDNQGNNVLWIAIDNWEFDHAKSLIQAGVISLLEKNKNGDSVFTIIPNDSKTNAQIQELITFAMLEYTQKHDYQKLYELFQSIIDSPTGSIPSKQRASVEIAEMILNGDLGSDISTKDVPEILESDTIEIRQQKKSLKQEILLTRAIEAYEYVIRLPTEESTQLMRRVRAMLAGKDTFDAVTTGANLRWLPDAVELFGTYYAGVKKEDRSFWSEYNYQKASLARNAPSTEPTIEAEKENERRPK